MLAWRGERPEARSLNLAIYSGGSCRQAAAAAAGGGGGSSGALLQALAKPSSWAALLGAPACTHTRSPGWRGCEAEEGSPAREHPPKALSQQAEQCTNANKPAPKRDCLGLKPTTRRWQQRPYLSGERRRTHILPILPGRSALSTACKATGEAGEL